MSLLNSEKNFETLSSEEIFKKLEKDPIGFIYSRKDIGYFSEEERKNLRLSEGLEEKLKNIFKNIKGFIADPVKSIIGIIFYGKPPYLTQFDKDIAMLNLRKNDNIRNKQHNFWEKIGNVLVCEDMK